ncbi:SNF2 family N-terminal domain-containing protein [Globomyces pollinis-pini]|nr:SNF2 family N-terminal domain-containing protein [Globomyces pollinis-pini]
MLKRVLVEDSQVTRFKIPSALQREKVESLESTVSAMKKVGVRERKVLTKHQIKELFDSGDELDDDCFDYMETESDDSDDEDYTGSISKPSESKRRLREAHKIRLDRRTSASKNSNTHKVNKCSPSTSSKTPTSSITTKSNGPSQSTTPAPVPSSSSTQKVYNRSENVDQNKSVITRSERNSIVPARTVHNDISKFFDEELTNIGNFLSQFKDGNFNTTTCLPNDLEDLEIPFYNQDILIFYPNAPNYTPVDDESVDFNYWHYFAYAIPFYPNLAERVELRPTMLEVTFGVPDYHTDCFDQYTICKYRSVTHRFDAETNLKTVLLNYMKAHPKQFYEPVPFTEFYDLDSNNCYVNPFDAIHNLSYNGVGFTYTEDGVKIEYFLNHNLSPEPVDMSPLKVFVRCPGKADNCPDYLIVDVYFDVNCFDTFDLNIIGSRYKSILDSQESALETSSINDTIEFVETIPKDGFKLALYNYQKRSLTWMLMAEHKAFSPDVTYMETSMLARFSASNQVVDLRTNKVLKHIPENLQDSAYRCIGGILADAPGNGKTVTMISLIHSNPLIKFNDLEMTDVEKTMCIPSKATLVICASNLVEQWKAEIATCLGPNVNCMSISTAKEFYESSWYDYMYSDIIIMPIVFLASSTYENMVSEEYKLLVKGEKLDPELYFSRKTVPMIENGYSSFWHQKGKVSLEAIFFHRIVYDEFHELNKSPASMKKLAFNMRARCIWGMTGFLSIVDYRDSKLQYH